MTFLLLGTIVFSIIFYQQSLKKKDNSDSL